MAFFIFLFSVFAMGGFVSSVIGGNPRWDIFPLGLIAPAEVIVTFLFRKITKKKDIPYPWDIL